MYFKSEYISNISSENIEKAIRNHSLKRYTSLDFKFTSTFIEEDEKYFFGVEKPKTIKITRIRSPFSKYVPKIILKFEKSNFKEYKIRFSAFTLIVFIYSFIALILNLISSIISNNISENLLVVLIGNVIFYSFVFVEYKTTIKKLNLILNLERK